MPFLYGGNVLKAHVGRWSEDCPEHQGVVVYSMNDTPLVSFCGDCSCPLFPLGALYIYLCEGLMGGYCVSVFRGSELRQGQRLRLEDWNLQG